VSARRTIAIVLAVAGLLGVASGVAWAAFSSTTTNVNSFSAKSDVRAPTADATQEARADGGGTAGQIQSGGTYYVYANVSDAGNPASGVQTVTADLSSFDTGVTAAALTTTGGPWTVGGTSYAYRTAQLTANSSLTGGASYSYSLTMTDVAGNSRTTTGFTVTIESTSPYADAITGTGGLLGYWRLGESSLGSGTDVVLETFTNASSGQRLEFASAGEIGATWTLHASSTSGTQFMATTARRAVREAAGLTMYYASGVPTSADYSVQADVYAMSLLTDDAVGVVGRESTSADTAYVARYRKVGTTTQSWELVKVVSGTETVLGSYAQTLIVGTNYHLKLDMQGSTIRLLVDAVQRVSVTDSSITAAGRAGIRGGYTGLTGVPGHTTGLQLDNVNAVEGTVTPAEDSQGTNDGAYRGGVTLAASGAIAGDSNTAAQFDGVNDYVSVSRQIADDFSIEFWFKSTQGLGTSTTWSSNAGLVDADVSGTENDFGVSLRSDGVITAGTGTPQTTIVSAGTGYNDGNWHHVVFTRLKSTGALKLYVDSGTPGTATGGTQSLTAPGNISFGRLQSATNYFAGTIDEVATYNTALSATTIADHFWAGAGSILKAQYKRLDPTAPNDQHVKPGLQLVNTGSESVSLAGIKVRYWFTKESGSTTFETWCDFAAIGCGSLTHQVVAVSPARTGADRYFEVTISSGTLAGSASTGEMQMRFNKSDFANFAEADDYSYGTGSTYADTTKVTVHHGNTLIWGTEPS
jgi:hypothetical protein